MHYLHSFKGVYWISGKQPCKLRNPVLKLDRTLERDLAMIAEVHDQGFVIADGTVHRWRNLIFPKGNVC